MTRQPIVILSLVSLIVMGFRVTAEAQEEVAMFGNTPSRNMVSGETGVPESWDPRSGENILWTQPVGSQAYGGPTVANGKVYVGTNNEGVRNPAYDGDKGVLMAFDATTGDFAWQMVHDKLSAGRVNDWPLQGVCSTAFVEGDRVWYVSNQAHVVCLDANGLADGNTGPFTDETGIGPTDGDIIWSYDMIGELDVFPHNLATGSPLIVGDTLYTVTSNGVDEGHVNIPSPFSPHIIALDKNTGELLWENTDVAEGVLHGSWTNPAYAEIDGRAQVIVAGGNGIVYSLDADTGETIWQFDCNPEDSEWILGGRGTRNNILSTPVVYDNKVYVGVGQDPEHGEAPGHFFAIDATGTGDVTDTHKVWSRDGDDFYRTMSTAAIADGILYISSLSGFLHALDPTTGEEFWTYDAFAAVWGSPFVVDGKVLLGDEDGDIAVLRAGKEMELLGEINMGASVYSTPVVRDGVMYLLTRNRLWAVKDGAQSEPLGN
ncbi:MAG: PQQ-binding-like beta-propeller repeat protein [Acidobacteriota bacterium]|nr:PQQ-binding-like beta-propeller repeat protein [Acidobacteriota bacterium]